MNKISRFILQLSLAFFIDICCMVAFKRPIVFFVGMFFVWFIVQEKQNWRVISSIIMLYLFESFISIGCFGLPLFYLVPLAYLAQKSRKLMHFSRAFYVCFLILLFFAQNIGVSFATGSWHLFGPAMIKILFLNVSIMIGVLWRYS